MKISFVIPCYRSENTIKIVVDEIIATMQSRANNDYEIILVNDSSPDDVWTVIKSLAKENKDVKGVCLAKNFGQHSALMAGYAECSGDYIVSLDDDGQTPASESLKLIEALDEETDIVYGCYAHQKQQLFRRFGTWLNRQMAISMIDMPENIQPTSFYAVKSFVIKEILKYKNPYPYIGGLVFRVTKKIKNVPVEHRERISGTSGYSIFKLIALWMNGFTAFSVKPLRIATFLGMFCAFIGFVAGVYVAFQKILLANAPLGYTSILASILFIGGMIMFLLGLIGEYIGRIYISLNQSPQYVIREKVN